mmetsp:Transcript_26585/g.67702  ORF Transcript_26585/g.67702 Transcript_26585/m.67702 type:complete len:468 (-) Transcript_26585:310-1713(-)
MVKRRPPTQPPPAAGAITRWAQRQADRVAAASGMRMPPLDPPPWPQHQAQARTVHTHVRLSLRQVMRTAQRYASAALCQHAGLTHGEIGHALTMPTSTVCHWCYRRLTDIRNFMDGAGGTKQGAARRLTPAQEAWVVRSAQRVWQSASRISRALSAARAINKRYTVHRTTVARLLRSHRLRYKRPQPFPAQSPLTHFKRWAFEVHWGNPLHARTALHIVFFDEKLAVTFHGLPGKWTALCDPYYQPTVQHPVQVHIAGGISFMGKTDLYILPPGKTWNTETYIEALRAVLLPLQARVWRTHHTFLMLAQDGAPCHWAKETQDFLREHRILLVVGPSPGRLPRMQPIQLHPVMPRTEGLPEPQPDHTTLESAFCHYRKCDTRWPPYSPDLNCPIENVWGELATAMEAAQPRSREDMEAACRNAWDAIDQDRCRHACFEWQPLVARKIFYDRPTAWPMRRTGRHAPQPG